MSNYCDIGRTSACLSGLGTEEVRGGFFFLPASLGITQPSFQNWILENPWTPLWKWACRCFIKKDAAHRYQNVRAGGATCCYGATPLTRDTLKYIAPTNDMTPLLAVLLEESNPYEAKSGSCSRQSLTGGQMKRGAFCALISSGEIYNWRKSSNRWLWICSMMACLRPAFCCYTEVLSQSHARPQAEASFNLEMAAYLLSSRDAQSRSRLLG